MPGKENYLVNTERNIKNLNGDLLLLLKILENFKFHYFKVINLNTFKQKKFIMILKNINKKELNDALQKNIYLFIQ